MVSYKITVKTGDKKGAGTDANVYLILHGKGTQTNKQTLDTFFKNDFERGNIDNYSVDSEVNIPEVQRIELWRDAYGLFSNWYLDWIEVTNLATNITSIFPAMKWIKENQRYFFNHIDTCLPQDDPFKEMRMVELQNIQRDYQLQVKVPGLPAQVKELPEDERFSFDYQFSMGLKGKIYREESQRLVMASGREWKDVEDVKSVYTTVFGVPQGSKTFNDDASFGRRRLNGLNPSILNLCSEIPKNFGVTEIMVKPFLEGKTMKQAMDDKRLFIIDLAILEGCPTVGETIMTCPFALFYFNDAKCLMPIAIQLFQKKGPSNPVFLPSDPEYTWMMAKMWYSVADSTYHQALTHLNFTHLMMEGICVAAKRNLAPSHPIMKLLNPHFIYLMAINSLALGTLINPGGSIDKDSSAGVNGHFYIIKKSMEFWRLDLHGTLPEDLKSRGVFDQTVLTGAYHMRDDALLLYDAIRTYVKKYVMHYYSADSSLTADYELQKWGAELVKSRDDGGVGILGVPNNGKFVATDQLVLTLTAIIYTCSVGHAAANFQQYDEYGAPFNYPYFLSGSPPKDKSPVTIETVLRSISNRMQLLQLMAATKVLSEKGTQSLGDFEKQLIVDPPAIKFVEEFRQNLREIGKTIDERNKKRKHPYDELHPSAIPNAISI
ncbi:allene oxide synthase-lipoxygenase protein-like isoform X1 [Mytilus californianus]|uniref:allene oxide synthase-lipoxygenase protein-like isoform X1 n=1 Tax=Mytilus californianus TaxID=6549 RepID=UPI0022471992|nr:allene oxide synthase-lipoxygenase protein-like isoform X1 [Mytilus californianus]